MMPGRLTLYIARRFTATLVVMLGAVTAVTFIADYIHVLQSFSDEEDFNALLGIELALMRVPILVDTALPFAFLFASLLSLIGLSRTLELVVARASGVSVWGFLRAPVAVALLVGALGTAILNPAAVYLKERAENLESELSGRAAWGSGHWFRQQVGDEVSIVHAGSADPAGSTLFGVTAFVFDASGAFREKATAPRAVYEEGRWVLSEAEVLSADEAPHMVARYELPTELSAAELQRSFVEPEAISVWELPGFIRTAVHTGIDPDKFRVALHALLNRPLLLVAMVMIAATVSLRLTRYGGLWRLILTGAVIGFLLYASSEIFKDLGGNGIIDPAMAAWLMPLVALVFGTTALLYQEDG